MPYEQLDVISKRIIVFLFFFQRRAKLKVNSSQQHSLDAYLRKYQGASWLGFQKGYFKSVCEEVSQRKAIVQFTVLSAFRNCLKFSMFLKKTDIRLIKRC